MSSAPVAVIYTWATYNYDSQDMQRELKSRQKKSERQAQTDGFLSGCQQERMQEQHQARLIRMPYHLQRRNAGRQDLEEVGIGKPS